MSTDDAENKQTCFEDWLRRNGQLSAKSTINDYFSDIVLTGDRSADIDEPWLKQTLEHIEQYAQAHVNFALLKQALNDAALLSDVRAEMKKSNDKLSKLSKILGIELS